MAFSTAEAEARKPLLKVVRDNYGEIADDAPVQQLARMARAFARGDPLIERQIRRLEDAAQNARAAPTSDDMAVRKDEFVDDFAACVSTAMDGEDIIGGVVAQLVAEVHNEVCDASQAKVDNLTARIAELEQTANLAARFNDLERALDLRQQARAAVKKGERGDRGPRGETGAQGRPGKDGRDGVSVTNNPAMGNSAGGLFRASRYERRLKIAEARPAAFVHAISQRNFRALTKGGDRNLCVRRASPPRSATSPDACAVASRCAGRR
jgi:hypothetical protein